MTRIRNFFSVALSYAAAVALAAFGFVTGFATNAINYVQGLLPYTVDSAIRSLNGAASNLERARAKAVLAAAAEGKLGDELATASDAAYDREDALMKSADRALRIRNRINDLLK